VAIGLTDGTMAKCRWPQESGEGRHLTVTVEPIGVRYQLSAKMKIVVVDRIT